MAKLRVPNSRRLGVDLAQSEKELVRQLVAFRKLHGLSKSEVARRMDVSRTTVVSFENLNSGTSKTHTFLTAKRYAEAVNAYIAYLAVDAGSVKKDGDQSTYVTIKERVSQHRKDLETDGADGDNTSVQQEIADAATCTQVEVKTRKKWENPNRPPQPVTSKSSNETRIKWISFEPWNETNPYTFRAKSDSKEIQEA